MKLLLKLLAAVLVALILALGALFFLPGERIARIAAERISAMTGREVTMQGDTAISFYPVLGISTGRTTIATADWASGGPMLTADSFKLGVDPIALIRGDVRITGLEVSNPHIVIERGPDGRGNWQIGVDGVAQSGQGGDGGGDGGDRGRPRSDALALTLDRAVITDATVTYIDQRNGTHREMTGASLDLRWPDYSGEGVFDAVLRPAGQDVRLKGRVAHLGPLMEGEASPFELDLSTKGGTMTLDGRASVAPQIDAALAADITSTRSFLAALGLPGGDPPPALGQSITLAAQLGLTEDIRISLRDMVLALGKNELRGAADLVTAGARPRLTAQLDAGALDLSTPTKDDGGSGGASQSVTSDGWSRAPIDASGLGALDAEVQLSASSLDLQRFTFGTARVDLTIDNARAVARLTQLEGYGGTLAGQVVANNRSGLSVGGDLTARGIDMEALLTDAADITRFATTGTASLDFLGVGQSVDAIMKSLSGSLTLATGRGKISGFDLDRLMRTGDGAGGTTVFDELGASFDIENGNMRGDDLAMSMPLATATGKGRIGLGARDIDYLFTPVLLEGESRRGLAIPVRITGPWSDPRIRPDLEKAIDLNFKKEREKLEDKAKDEVRREIDKFVEKNLGVKKDKGESAKDAIKKNLKKEAVDEIFKLFE